MRWSWSSYWSARHRVRRLLLRSLASFGAGVAVIVSWAGFLSRATGSDYQEFDEDDLALGGAISAFSPTSVAYPLIKAAGQALDENLPSSSVFGVRLIVDLGSRNFEVDLLNPPGASGASPPVRDVTPAEGFPINAEGAALGISGDGNVLAGYYDMGLFTPFHAVRWSEATGLVDLGTLDPPNNSTKSSFAHDVSDDGSVIVGFSQTTDVWDHAFRWTAAHGMVDLGTGAGPGADRMSRAYDTNVDGSVIVGVSNFPASTGAFRWTESDGFQNLGTNTRVATAVTADGSVVVGQGVNPNRAFRWTAEGGVQSLGVLPDHTWSLATGVSDDGSIVVGISSSGYLAMDSVGGTLNYSESEARAFYWTEAGGIQDLTQLLIDAGVDMTGRTIAAATALTPDGKWIMGSALTPETEPGDTRAFLASLTETLPDADFDEDGFVTGADLPRWQNNMGTGSTHLTGDADFDADVDGGDFLLWQRQLGNGALSAANAAVPEPTTSVLALLGSLAAMGTCRRRRRRESCSLNNQSSCTADGGPREMNRHAKHAIRRSVLAVAIICQFLAVDAGLAFFPSTAPNLAVTHIIDENGSHFFSRPYHYLNTPMGLQVANFSNIVGKQKVEVRWHKDPSVAYNFELTNQLSDPSPIALFHDSPIRPLGANSSWGELTVELIDANGDGQASLAGDYGTTGAIQGVTVYNSTTFVGEAVGPPIGSGLTAPGTQLFTLSPFAGPTPPTGNMLQLATRFILSPGDTVRLRSRFIIDEGTGIPFAEIPSLPDPADGPFLTSSTCPTPKLATITSSARKRSSTSSRAAWSASDSTPATKTETASTLRSTFLAGRWAAASSPTPAAR
jgi:probable HAF family extracellular repeat protein